MLRLPRSQLGLSARKASLLGVRAKASQGRRGARAHAVALLGQSRKLLRRRLTLTVLLLAEPLNCLTRAERLTIEPLPKGLRLLRCG